MRLIKTILLLFISIFLLSCDEDYKYKVNYNLDGGVCELLIDEYNENEKIILPTPIKEGYKFLGWYEVDENGLLSEIKIDILEKKDYNLKAKWEKINIDTMVIVTFKYGSFFDDELIEVEIGEKVTPLKEKTVGNYTFIGWYTDEEFKTPYDFTKEVNNNITLYAKYQINEEYKYTIKYELEGGSISDEVIGFNDFKDLHLSTPTKEGYTFLGWFEEINNEMVKVENFENRNYTLYAKWYENIYTVEYNLRGGSLEELISDFVHNEPFDLPVPTRNASIFLYWYEEINGKEVIVEYLENRNYKLYAKWELSVYNISYDLDGGILNNPITEFKYPNIPVIENPIKEGFIFLGWIDKNEVIDANNLQYKDYQLKAWFTKEYIPYELLETVYPLPMQGFAPKQTNFSVGIPKIKNKLENEILINIGYGNIDNLKYQNMKILINISESNIINDLESYENVVQITDFNNGFKYQKELLPYIQNEQQLLNPYANKLDYIIDVNKFKEDGKYINNGYINIVMILTNDKFTNYLSDYKEYRIRQISFNIDEENNEIVFGECIYKYK